MNKFILYIVLLLVYLGLSKSFSPSEFGIDYIINEQSLDSLIPGTPVSVILVDSHTTGFIIKTHYHKYKVIYGPASPQTLIVRTSASYVSKHKNHIGMSIFRRFEDGSTSFTSVIPGTIFIGNSKFGHWIPIPSGGTKWYFYRAYRSLYKTLGWGSWRPTKKEFQNITFYQQAQKNYYGEKEEFGTQGSITQKVLKHFADKKHLDKNTISLNNFFLQYFSKTFYYKKIHHE